MLSKKLTQSINSHPKNKTGTLFNMHRTKLVTFWRTKPVAWSPSLERVWLWKWRTTVCLLVSLFSIQRSSDVGTFCIGRKGNSLKILHPIPPASSLSLRARNVSCNLITACVWVIDSTQLWWCQKRYRVEDSDWDDTARTNGWKRD